MRATSGLVAVLLLSLTGCGGGGHDESLLGSPGASPSKARPHAVDSRSPEQRLLDRRAKAVLDDDEQAFLAPVARNEPVLLARQRRLFDNLQRLPVERLAFTPDGGHRVLRRLTLRGFDAGPEVGMAGFDVERRGGRLRVVPAPAADRATDPWDLDEVEVRTSSHVLGVFDRASYPRASDVMVAVSNGATDVGDALPGDWDRNAVVYVFRDPAVLASYARVPGGNLQHLGGLSFPVRGGANGQKVVGSRVALLPGAMDADTAELDRIVRHELTHVALGARAKDVPLWLSEGIAEYVAALPVRPSHRRIATIAVHDAEAGLLTLPDAATFNDDEQDLHYSVAWMACDYLAARHGDTVLWRLLDAMRRAHVGRAGSGQDAVLRSVVGMDSTQLAQHASARIVKEFGPGPGSATLPDSVPDPTN
jgi:hypothetical protein